MKSFKQSIKDDVVEEVGMGVADAGVDGGVDGVLGDGDNTIPSKVGKVVKRKSIEDDEDETD